MSGLTSAATNSRRVAVVGGSIAPVAVLPKSDSSHSLERREGVHSTRDNIRPSISVEIAHGGRNEVDRLSGDAARDEVLPTVVLQPNEACALRILPIVEHAGHDDVEVSIVI